MQQKNRAQEAILSQAKTLAIMIRGYSISQKELWHQVPALALEAAKNDVIFNPKNLWVEKGRVAEQCSRAYGHGLWSVKYKSTPVFKGTSFVIKTFFLSSILLITKLTNSSL